MKKALVLSLLMGVCSTLLYSLQALGGILVFISWFSSLPLMWVGFRYGVRHNLIAAGTGVLVITALIHVIMPLYVLFVTIPSVLIVWLAAFWRPLPGGGIEWAPTGRILGGLSLAGIVILCGGLLWLGYVNESSAEAAIVNIVDKFMILAKDAAGLALSQNDPEAIAELTRILAGAQVTMSSALGGIWISGWLIFAVLNGALALHFSKGNSFRPAPVFKETIAPEWISFTFLGTGLLSFVLTGDAGYICQNIAIFLATPLFLTGLAMVHGFVKGRSNAGMLLGLFYVALFLLSGWAVALVIGLGLMQFWMRLLWKKNSSGNQEDK